MLNILEGCDLMKCGRFERNYELGGAHLGS